MHECIDEHILLTATTVGVTWLLPNLNCEVLTTSGNGGCRRIFTYMNFHLSIWLDLSARHTACDRWLGYMLTRRRQQFSTVQINKLFSSATESSFSVAVSVELYYENNWRKMVSIFLALSFHSSVTQSNVVPKLAPLFTKRHPSAFLLLTDMSIIKKRCWRSVSRSHNNIAICITSLAMSLASPNRYLATSLITNSGTW